MTFGLLTEEEQKRLIFECREWHLAISKATGKA